MEGKGEGRRGLAWFWAVVKELSQEETWAHIRSGQEKSDGHHVSLHITSLITVTNMFLVRTQIFQIRPQIFLMSAQRKEAEAGHERHRQFHIYFVSAGSSARHEFKYLLKLTSQRFV